MRYFFTVKKFWQQRRQLYAVVVDAKYQAPNMTDISWQELHQQGIRLLIIDFDGVLAAHGELTVSEDAAIGLKAASSVFGSDNIIILSNKPTTTRLTSWQENFPDIEFFVAKKRKPYPDGVQAILKNKQREPKNAIVIDDRLATGVLAAVLAGCKPIYITQPKQSFMRRPIAETFFALLRCSERALAKCMN